MSVLRLEPEAFDWATGAGGAAEVRRVLAEAVQADGRSALNEAALLTLRHHNLDTGMLLVAGAQTEGFVYVHGLYGQGRPELDLVVAPSARRRGVGTSLARAALEHLAGIPVTAWSHGDHPAAGAIAGRLGFVKARELWLMRRPLDAEVPAPELPPGVSLRPFEVGRDEEALLAVNAAAFASHPEQGGLTRRGLDERIGEPWFDASGFLVASRGARIVGFHWTKRHAGPTPHGEVYVIGVHPDEQGTGLGRALLWAGLARLRAQGLEEVVLYVEAENRAAVRLYASTGFTHTPEDTDVMYAPRPG